MSSFNLLEEPTIASYNLTNSHDNLDDLLRYFSCNQSSSTTYDVKADIMKPRNDTDVFFKGLCVHSYSNATCVPSTPTYSIPHHTIPHQPRLSKKRSAEDPLPNAVAKYMALDVAGVQTTPHTNLPVATVTPCNVEAAKLQKRERNKLAAERCRRKRVEEKKNLQEENDLLREKVRSLEDRLKDMEALLLITQKKQLDEMTPPRSLRSGDDASNSNSP